MKWTMPNRRTLALLAVLLPLAVLFVWVALRSGPLAPVPVTVATVEKRALAPALFGVGTVESRYVHRIGPTFPGRLRALTVHVGDAVRAGQLLGEMDPVELDDRIDAKGAVLQRVHASRLASEARVQDAAARTAFAVAQAVRYERLLPEHAVSEEAVEARRQERQAAEANLIAARADLEAARQELTRARAERDALVQQRANLRLVSPVDGLVVVRAADPGTTVVAGQPVVEIIDPQSLWINVRFDQQRAAGLRAGLEARIVLRSHAAEPLAARVLRIEPLADAVTEEVLAKVVFEPLPASLPPIGELAEVTVALPEVAARPVIPNAGVRRVDGQLGVWVIENDALRFAPVRLGAADLDGRVQVLEGLAEGERIALYTPRALAARQRIRIVERLPGVS